MEKLNIKTGLTVPSLILLGLVVFIVGNTFALSMGSYQFAGTVFDSSANATLEGARAHCYVNTANTTDYIDYTDSAGRYNLQNVTAGFNSTIIFTCSHEGYDTQEIRKQTAEFPGGFGIVDFRLEPNSPDWPMFRGNVARTGFKYKEDKLTPPLRLLWSYSYTSEGEWYSIVESSPVIFGDRLFVCGFEPWPGDRFGIFCFDLNTGQIIWRYTVTFTTEGYIWSTPCVYNGRLYLASRNGYLLCLDINNGNEIWRTFLGGSFNASPLIVNDTLYIGQAFGNFSELFAIDPATGQEKTSVLIDSGIYSSAVVEGKRLYLAVSTASPDPMQPFGVSLRCFDISQSNNIIGLWRVDLPAGISNQSTPVIYEDVLYYSTGRQSGGTTLFCLDRFSGEIILTYDVSDEFAEITSPAIAYGNIYIAAGNKFYCLNLDRLYDGNPLTEPILWTYDLSTPDRYGIMSSPTVANGYIYFGAGDMYEAAFYCVDAFTGEELWKYNNSSQGMGYSICSPAVADGKVVFVSAHDFSWSGVYCFANTTVVTKNLPAGWNMISVPLIPVNADPASVFAGNSISGNLHRYDHAGQRYVNYYDFSSGEFGKVKRGEGYWFNCLNPAGCQVQYAGHTNSGNLEIDLPTAGWYMIGALNDDVGFNNILVRRGTVTKPFSQVVNLWIQDPLAGYDNATHGYFAVGIQPTDNDHYFRAWQGYWLYTFVDNLKLIIPQEITAETQVQTTSATTTATQSTQGGKKVKGKKNK